MTSEKSKVPKGAAVIIKPPCEGLAVGVVVVALGDGAGGDELACGAVPAGGEAETIAKSPERIGHVSSGIIESLKVPGELVSAASLADTLSDTGGGVTAVDCVRGAEAREYASCRVCLPIAGVGVQ